MCGEEGDLHVLLLCHLEGPPCDITFELILMVGYLVDSFGLHLHSKIASVDAGKMIFGIFPLFQYPRSCQL